MCGEKVLWLFVIELIKGSPPRVRGKEVLIGTPVGTVGITPACAGKRSKRRKTSSSRGDHPRVCGEKEDRYREAARDGGSPPRVRGKVISNMLFTPRERITPACAGKRVEGIRVISTVQDHPRVCGEKQGHQVSP